MGFGSGYAGGSGLIKRRKIEPKIGATGPRIRISSGRSRGLSSEALQDQRQREDELLSRQEQNDRIADNLGRREREQVLATEAGLRERELELEDQKNLRNLQLQQQQLDRGYDLKQQAQWDASDKSQVENQALQQKATREQQLFDMSRDHQLAAKQLITGDPSGVVDYVNRYGSSAVNLEGITLNEDGSLSVIRQGEVARVQGPDGNIAVVRNPGQEVARFASAKDLYTQFFGRMKPEQMGETKAQKRITETHIVSGRKQLMESFDGGQTWAPVGEAAPGKDNTRPMSSSVEKRITSAAELSDHMDRLGSTFQDQYGGSPIGGLFDVENTYLKLTGDPSGQAQWWQDYQMYLNDVRHDKFGSALTATEKGEFLKAAVTPKMDPEEIRKNLLRQRDLSALALDRIAQGYAVDYNPEAINAFVGRQIVGQGGNGASGGWGEQQGGDFEQPRRAADGKLYIRRGGQIFLVEE